MSASFRHTSVHSSASNMHPTTVGNSISAHPLLPLGDSNLSVEVSKLSAMSMGGPMAGLGSPTTRSVSLPRGTVMSWRTDHVKDTEPSTPTKTNALAPRPTMQSETTWEDRGETSSATENSSPLQRVPKYTSTGREVIMTEEEHEAALKADTGTTATSTINSIVATKTTCNSQRHRSDSLLECPKDAIVPETHLSDTIARFDAEPNAEYPSQTHSESETNDAPPRRRAWRRSASCKDLCDFSFEESGQAKSSHPLKRREAATPWPPKAISTDEAGRDSPITRFEDHRSIYSASSRDNSLEIHQDIIVVSERRIFSTSHLGAVLSFRTSAEDPGNYELRDSQEDLSHDSYELLEEVSDDEDEPARRPRMLISARSASLDSASHCPPSDQDDPKKKCRSSSDVPRDIFVMDEDPRDFPREIFPRNSDGSFYKTYKSSSRQSSTESKSEKSRAHVSRSSSQESREGRQSLKRNRSADNLRATSPPSLRYFDSRTSSVESKSEYYDAPEESHVRSMNLQNVQIETANRREVSARVNVESIDWSSKTSTEKSVDSTDNNIFSFDEDKIQFLQHHHQDSMLRRRDVFLEIEPRRVDFHHHYHHQETRYYHQPIERTKSDPNSLAIRQARLNAGAGRRLLLTHQKSIDLTPAESSDEDYLLYKQIPPSAPPIVRCHGTHFEMPPSAEFGHFDVLKRGAREKFEVPKHQFEELGAKNQSDLINLPPKNNDEISYILHKRHVVINGAKEAELDEPIKPDGASRKQTKDDRTKAKDKENVNGAASSAFLFTQNVDLSKIDPVTLEVDKEKEKAIERASSPRRDITVVDPVVLEQLSSKLSQIESDSPTSSKTESFRKAMASQNEPNISPLAKIPIIESKITAPEIVTKSKPFKSKRVIKARMQPGAGKKGTKTCNKTCKVRITSFSSDDESLDSDDVFGSAEATPTRMEFSPPQTRKEMESILKFESERKYLQYTMSSTEVEGSPPQQRKATKAVSQEVELELTAPTELRRISERSLSIPSSEDDANLNRPVFAEAAVDAETERRKKERTQLLSEIEEDIKNLQVPAKTKITEIVSPQSAQRKSGAVLFAHARLNLSEGSAFSILQKQQATESPIAGRRAISLDAPIVPVNRLPPLNSFSSKDDTVDEDGRRSGYATATDGQSDDDILRKSSIDNGSMDESEKIIEKDQIVPDVIASKKGPKVTTATKPPTKSKGKLTIARNKKPVPPLRTSSRQTKINGETRAVPAPKNTPITSPDAKRSKSQEGDAAGKNTTKERAKSLEKLELKRTGSKERSKSQEDSDTDISKRREKQQMLYETAIKQTKSLKSPVKDALPVFPQVEEMVRERHGKLEISINTIENTSVSLEEAIIITKSPKKLDKKLDKLTKSLELNLSDEGGGKKMERLGKSLDLDNRTKEEPDTAFSFTGDFVEKAARTLEQDKVVLEGTSLDVWLSMKPQGEPKKLQDVTVIKQGEDFFEGVAAADMEKASRTVAKFMRKKFGKKVEEKADDLPNEGGETKSDSNFLSVDDVRKHALFKSERSRSDDTGSWMTLECEEFAGTESSFEMEQQEEKIETENIRAAATVRTNLEPNRVLKRGSDHSKSSDSWTSGEKDTSPSRLLKGETDGESSLSCTIGRVVGIGQPEIVDHIDKDQPRSPRSPRICVLGRTFTMDEGFQRSALSSDEEDLALDAEKSTARSKSDKYPFDEKWSGDSELSRRLQEKLNKKIAQAESNSSVDEPGPSLQREKRHLQSVEKLSTESRNSVDTESSSGSFGAAARVQKGNDVIPKGLSSTWKPFPLDSSGSESFEDANVNGERRTDERNDRWLYRENSGEFIENESLFEKSDETDETPTRDGTEIPEDLANLSNTIGFFGGIAEHAPQTGFLSRTLSRISERSTNSERSSAEDSTKASTSSDVLKNDDESSNRHAVSNGALEGSPSSEDPPSYAPKIGDAVGERFDVAAFALQRQISDDRRTSAEMAELSMDDIEMITSSERGVPKLRRQRSDDTIIDEEEYEDEKNSKPAGSSSQESEEWPLPEIPAQGRLATMHEGQSSDASQPTTQVYQLPTRRSSIPRTFGLRGSLRSQDSEQWPSPPSSVIAECPVPYVDHVETYYVNLGPEEPCKVHVDSTSTNDNDDDDNSDNENRTIETTSEKTHTYENVATASGGSVSESLSVEVEKSGVRIVQLSASSDEDSNLNDDVFDAGAIEHAQLRPPTALRRSTASDDSTSHSDRRKSSGDDRTSSTNVDGGTVRLAAAATSKNKKCTHSSHSEDTSIALSLSEWSNSTNTVKFQTLSSNSGGGGGRSVKSEENSIADVPSQSMSDFSELPPVRGERLETVAFEAPPPVFVSDHAEEEEIEIEPRTTVHTQRYDKKQSRSLVDQPAIQRRCAASKTPPILSKCSPYYSSSLSSESTTPLASASPIRTATVPLTRNRKPQVAAKCALFAAKSPPSENDSTSSVESPKSRSEHRRPGYHRRRRQPAQRRHRVDEAARARTMDEMAAAFRYERMMQAAGYDEGYYPDDSGSSDIFRMERDEDVPSAERFDVDSIPPPLLEDLDESDGFESKRIEN